MTTSIAVSELDKLSMPTASGSGYSRQAYAIEYSPKLARSDGKVVTGVKIDRARELLKPAGPRRAEYVFRTPNETG